MMFSRVPSSLVVLAVGAAIASSAAAQGLPDEFNSGEDSRYTRHDPLAAFGAPGTWSFPPGAYRMQAGPSPDPALLGVQRMFSTRDQVVAGNFTIGINIVGWDPGVPTSIGLFTNMQEIGFGTTDGDFIHVDVGGAGPSALVYDRIVDDHVTIRTIESIPALLPDHDYSLIITPGLNGSWVFLYDTADLVTPIMYFNLSGFDEFGGGAVGFGTTGIAGVHPGPGINSPVDATFDHFVALPGPATGVLGVLGAAFAVRRRRWSDEP